MRVAQIAPLFETVPPPRYGGTERVVAALCDGLVARGVEVTLFAAAGSHTTARLAEMAPAPLREHMTRVEMEQVAPHLHLDMLERVFATGGDFDVVHSHADLLTLPFARRAAVPTLLTLHGRLDTEPSRQVLPRYPTVPLVSISDSQRRPLLSSRLNWLGTAYNGLPLDSYFAATPGSGDYLAFVGRINPEKRPDQAVEVAQRAGLPLRVAAKVDPCDVDYWESEIRPLFRRNNVDFLGEIAEADKPAFLAGARALVFPIDWPEPFGLVMPEALAAGTPVIARNRGSVPEVLSDGVSGFICETIDEMAAAVERAGEIDPRSCRCEARRFTADAMVERYLALYRQLLDDQQDEKSSITPIESARKGLRHGGPVATTDASEPMVATR